MTVSTEALEFFFREGPTVFFTATTGSPWAVTSISENVEKQLGYSVGYIYAHPNFFWDVLHPDDQESGLRNAESLSTVGRASHLCRMRRADGSYILAQGEFRLLRTPEGAPQAVIGYWNDQTERERSRAIISAIPDAIFEVDEDGRFGFFQAPEGQEYVDPVRVIGATMHDLMPKDIADLLLNAVRRAITTRVSQSVKYAVPVEGGWRHHQADIGTSLNRNAAVALVRDVTPDVLHEQVLTEQKRFLEEANTSLEQFVYVASHDLREPLIGVAGYATLLQRRFSKVLDEQGAHWVDSIVQGTKNMEAKIDALLDLSRVNRGNYSGTFPLGAALEAGRKCLLLPLKGAVNVEFQIPDVLPLIRGDRGQVTQVFQNLFSNSIKYRKPEVPVRIEVSVQDEVSTPGMCLIVVKDNGVGFDMKHSERIWGVFQRLYTMEQFPGTGIGLAIVKKIIERHRGKVWAVSEPDHGATFFFTLPKA